MDVDSGQPHIPKEVVTPTDLGRVAHEPAPSSPLPRDPLPLPTLANTPAMP